MPTNYVKLLKDFHKKYRHHEGKGTQQPKKNIAVLRYKLIDEEVNKELLPILKKLEKKAFDRNEYLSLISELSDALADSLYVIFGTCVSYGIPIDDIFEEVHRSNMTKSMKKDTKSIKGKTIKGENYQPPSFTGILIRNGF